MSKLTGKELANELTNFVNGYNQDNHTEFIDAFCREHRTLQQSGLRLIFKLIERVASEEYTTDARNETSHKVAKQMLDGFKVEVIKQYISEGTSEDRAKGYVEGYGSLPHRYLGTI